MPGSCPVQIRYRTADPLDELISDQTARQLWRFVEGLPTGERSAVILYYRQELKVAEVAKVLGVTSGTVKTLLFRARQHLKDALKASTPRLGGTCVDL